MFKPDTRNTFNYDDDDNNNVYRSLLTRSRNTLCQLNFDPETYIRFLHVVNFILISFLFIMVIIIEEEVKPTYLLMKKEMPKMNQMLINLQDLLPAK